MDSKSKKPAGNARHKVNKPDGALALKITSFGITAETANSLARTVGKHRAVQEFLKGTRHRLLTFELLDPPDSETKPPRATPQDRFRATFFDYTNNRTVFANGSIAKPRQRVNRMVCSPCKRLFSNPVPTVEPEGLTPSLTTAK